MLARSRTDLDPRRYRAAGVELESTTVPIHRGLQGSKRLSLDRHQLRAHIALRQCTHQTGTDALGTTDVRDRRHQDAADRSRLALRRRHAQGRADRAARESDSRYLRGPRIFRRMVPERWRGTRALVRKEPGRALAAKA